MTKQFSFSKYENEVLPDFRQKINLAESTEDVKKFFVYTAKELFDNIFEGKLELEYEDISLLPGEKPYYVVSDRLRLAPDFSSVWKDSDLPRVIGRLAETSSNRYRHLEKKPEKTDAKIRM